MNVVGESIVFGSMSIREDSDSVVSGVLLCDRWVCVFAAGSF